MSRRNELAGRVQAALDALPDDADALALRGCWEEIAPAVRELAGASDLEAQVRERLLAGKLEQVRNLLRVASSGPLPRRPAPRWVPLTVLALSLGIWAGSTVAFKAVLAPDLCTECCREAGLAAEGDGVHRDAALRSMPIATACRCTATPGAEVDPPAHCSGGDGYYVCSEPRIRFHQPVLAGLAALPLLIALFVARRRRR